MHDTGKIGVPDAVLDKPGPLNAEEWRIMKTHCQIGYDILSKSAAPIFKLAAEIALYHHEKWNGAGYPKGLIGEAIPISARIVAVADVYDALTMRRPYKEPWLLEKAFATIREGAGLHFDPRIAEAFLDIRAQIYALEAEWALKTAAINANGEI